MINYEKLLNKTVTDIKPSGIRKFFDIAATMDGVISLGVGEPDFQTPWKVRSAGMESLASGKTKYTSNSGLLPLRNAICAYLDRKYGLKYTHEETLITVGGSEAIDMSIRALINPGDEVIIPQPSYVCYEPITRLAGGVPVIIETKVEDEFKLTAKDLKERITDKTKMIIMPFPCNPTGAIMEEKDIKEIYEVIKDTDIIVLSDEIYAELTFNEKGHVSVASVEGMKERTLTVNGFSKAFSMTGWRLGYVCGPVPLIKQITKIHQFAIMCAPTTSQYAAVTALENCDDEVECMKEEYDMRRKFIVSEFNRIGLKCHEPKGAFYVFPSIKSSGLSSDEFCEKLLYSKHVAIVPGTAFGKGGEGFARVSYCYSFDHLKEAIAKIEEFLNEL